MQLNTNVMGLHHVKEEEEEEEWGFYCHIYYQIWVISAQLKGPSGTLFI